MANKDKSISTPFPKMRSTTIALFLLLSLWLVLGTSVFGMRHPVPSRNARPWQQVAADKRNGNLAKIPDEWRLKPEVIEEGKKQRSIAGSFIESLLDSDTRHITGLDPVEIIKSTTSGKLSSLAVTKAFCKRAAFAHQLNTNLLEINFDAALARARELDDFFSAHDMPVGPLHGLPVSLKDQFHIKGLDTSMGYIGWIGKERPVESELVRQLVDLGAIPIAKVTRQCAFIKFGMLTLPDKQYANALGKSQTLGFVWTES
ncbi:hypothetical protein LTS15_008823 [Exophiala xenobiotica]|nr:hypothetical protein LTS15_008823 [Exophiala xenobiotica]